MAVTKGTGQGSGGKGLLVTAVTQGTAQTLHTAVVGVLTADLAKFYVVNNSAAAVTLTLVFEPRDATDAVTVSEIIPASSGLYQLTNQLENVQIPLNDTMVVKVFASVASVLTTWARVDNQSTYFQHVLFQSGHVLMGSALTRHRMNGLVADATETNHQILIPRAGYLANLRARASATFTNAAAVEVMVRVNAANTALTFVYLQADTTVLKRNATPVAVSAGDLVTIKFVELNTANPVADMLAVLEYHPEA